VTRRAPLAALGRPSPDVPGPLFQTQLGIRALRSLATTRLLGPVRPDRIVRMALAPLQIGLGLASIVALGAAFAFVAGVGLFLATAVLLLKGGPTVGPLLSLLGQYLVGFGMTWRGAAVGSVEAGAGAFALGYATAKLRNHTLAAYAALTQRRVAADLSRRVLDDV